ncbi:MAG: alanine racemase [Blastocatellia bacterium]|nr:MAG: alanine racemase [Blastocatellia bacterium]
MANSNSETQRPTWAEINLDNLANNFNTIRNRVGPNITVMPMLKANAYGHGAVQCARRLSAEGANWFGVALPEEGVELREAGIAQQILCLGGFWQEQADICIQRGLTPVVFRVDMVDQLNQFALAAGRVVNVHIKVDTGMGRLGVRFDQLGEFLLAIENRSNIWIDGLLTHFAAADDSACQPLTLLQIQRFNDAVELLRQRGHRPTHLHLANSAAIFGQRDAWGNMVRPGGSLYGLWRDVWPLSIREPDLEPIMSLHSRIILLKRVPPGETIGYGCTFEASRPSLIATLPIGYHDGYIRGLSNRAHVVVRGTYAPVVGRVSMDFTLIDVTDVAGVEVGDPVMLLGRSGDLSITAEDLARIVGTISYEVTCGISNRVPRHFKSKT